MENKMNEKEKLYADAIERFGIHYQTYKLIEELSELIRAALKLRQSGPGRMENFIDEIADVEIMIEQMKQGYRIADAVALRKSEKLIRLRGIVDAD